MEGLEEEEEEEVSGVEEEEEEDSEVEDEVSFSPALLSSSPTERWAAYLSSKGRGFRGRGRWWSSDASPIWIVLFVSFMDINFVW